MTEEPLVWTSKGNLPQKDLRYEAFWDYKAGQYVKLVQRHYLGDEIVKESAHVLSLTGVSATGEVTKLG